MRMEIKVPRSIQRYPVRPIHIKSLRTHGRDTHQYLPAIGQESLSFRQSLILIRHVFQRMMKSNKVKIAFHRGEVTFVNQHRAIIDYALRDKRINPGCASNTSIPQFQNVRA